MRGWVRCEGGEGRRHPTFEPRPAPPLVTISFAWPRQAACARQRSALAIEGEQGVFAGAFLSQTCFSIVFLFFFCPKRLIPHRGGRHQKRRGGIKAPRPRRCTDPLCVQVCVSLQARASTVAATRFASSAGSLCQLSVCASSCFSCENTRLNATHIPFCLAGRRHAIAGCGSPRHGHHACTVKWWPPLRLRCCASAASVRNRSLTGHTVLGGGRLTQNGRVPRY